MEKMKEWWSKLMPQTGNKMYKFQQKLKFIKNEIKLWTRKILATSSLKKGT